MSNTINNKLKASVKASLNKAKTSKKKTQEGVIGDYLDNYRSCRPKDVCVFKIKYHNRARLDHSKFPGEIMHPLENSPIFAVLKDADTWCINKEKEDKENYYFAAMTWVPEPDIPKDVMKKITKRGW